MNFKLKKSLLCEIDLCDQQTTGGIVSDVGPASVIVGNLVQGNRLAAAHGRDMGHTDDSDAARKVFHSKMYLL